MQRNDWVQTRYKLKSTTATQVNEFKRNNASTEEPRPLRQFIPKYLIVLNNQTPWRIKGYNNRVQGAVGSDCSSPPPGDFLHVFSLPPAFPPEKAAASPASTVFFLNILRSVPGWVWGVIFVAAPTFHSTDILGKLCAETLEQLAPSATQQPAQPVQRLAAPALHGRGKQNLISTHLYGPKN